MEGYARFANFITGDTAGLAGGEGEQRQSRSRAVQLAAMLSQFAGGCVPPCSRGMGFLWNANTPRSGKTLLAKLAIIPVHGSVAIQSWASKDDELKKILDAEVLRAASYIFFDNVRGHIASQAIEAFITSPMWTGRILGKTEMPIEVVLLNGQRGEVPMTIQPRLAHRHDPGPSGQLDHLLQSPGWASAQ